MHDFCFFFFFLFPGFIFWSFIFFVVALTDLV